MRWIKPETITLKLLVPSGLTVAAAVGAGVGYVVASKILDKKYRAIADTEIAEAKVFYQKMYSRPVFVADEVEEEKSDTEIMAEWTNLPEEDQQRIMTNAVQAMKNYEAEKEVSKTDPRPALTSTIVNVFANPTPPGEEVLEALLADRDPGGPYIITKQEFYENEPDHEQRQFTYYEGDDVFVDDKEEYDPIQDIEKVVGDDNLLRFGYGSGDEYTLYVRNEAVDPPFDLYITKSTGKYTEEVLGVDENEPHLKHSQPRKFRLKDD